MDLPYRPVLPPPGMRETLVCEWEATFGGPLHMVPDGCVELMWIEGRGALVCGPEETAWSAHHQHPVRAAGVRLRPGAAAALLGLDLDEITNTRVRMVDLWGSARGRRLDEQLDECGEGQRAVLLRQVLSGAEVRPRRLPEAVVRAVADQMPVRELARDLALSERQLQRLSRREFGYGLTRLRAILRLQRAMALALRQPRGSLADLAALAGYADQSHLARDCATIAGTTPTQVFASAAPHWHGAGAVVRMSDSSKPAPAGRA